MNSESARSQQLNPLTLKSPRPLGEWEGQLEGEVQRTADPLLQVQYPVRATATRLEFART